MSTPPRWALRLIWHQYQLRARATEPTQLHHLDDEAAPPPVVPGQVVRRGQVIGIDPVRWTGQTVGRRVPGRTFTKP